jgi:hypothetical protein
MATFQHFLTPLRAWHPIARRRTRHRTLRMRATGLTCLLRAGSTGFVARFSAFRMVATNLTRFAAGRARRPIVARLGAAMAAGRVVPAASHLADAVVLPRNSSVLAGIAAKTGALAPVAASTVQAAFRSAAIVGGVQVFVTLHFDFVIAAWDGACDLPCATNRGGILSLPTPRRREPMATWKGNINIIQAETAFLLTRLSAWKRARMLTTLVGPGAFLQALYRAVQDVRVASSGARMTAVKSLVAWEVASALGREPEKVIRLTHKQPCVRMSWALELQAPAETGRRLQHTDDIGPHRNVTTCVRVADNVHSMLRA